MAVIGPRPALWNQDDLIAERDKYGANDVRDSLLREATHTLPPLPPYVVALTITTLKSAAGRY